MWRFSLNYVNGENFIYFLIIHSSNIVSIQNAKLVTQLCKQRKHCKFFNNIFKIANND